MFFCIKREQNHIIFEIFKLRFKFKENDKLKAIYKRFWANKYEYIIKSNTLEKSFEIMYSNNNHKDIYSFFESKYGSQKANDLMLKEYIRKVPLLVKEEMVKLEAKDIDQPSDYVWTMWLQENPPQIVQACLNSIKRIYPNLIIITEANIKNYIEIPEYIKMRLDKKEMSCAHFSDWVRSVLLDNYGGLWLDATLLLTQPIPDDLKNSSFNILRAKRGGISNWLIKSNKNNYLIKSLRIYLEEYWKNEDFHFNYFMFHQFFVRYVKQDETAKKIYENTKFFDNKPAFMMCNQSFRNGYGHLGEDYEEEYYSKVKESYFVQKLTYKDKAAASNPNSYYWHIVNEYVKDEEIQHAKS